MLHNTELKRKRGYTDPKTIVRVDGSEVLHGKDWATRKDELWNKAGGRCEYNIPDMWPNEGFSPQRCSETSGDPCHIVPRHPRRDDRLENLKFYCRRHHELTEKQSWRRVRWTKKPEAA